MLVISRRVGEVLYITDEATGMELGVAVLGFTKGQVRLGFQLPQGWNTQRAEQRYPELAKADQVDLIKKH